MASHNTPELLDLVDCRPGQFVNMSPSLIAEVIRPTLLGTVHHEMDKFRQGIAHEVQACVQHNMSKLIRQDEKFELKQINEQSAYVGWKKDKEQLEE